MEGGVGEVGGVEGGGGKAAEGGSEGFWREGSERAQFPALDGFGEERGTGDGGGAAAAEETDFTDEIVFDDGGEMKDIAADGITDFDFCVSGGEFTGVAGMLEMIEENFGEHGGIIAAEGIGRNSRMEIKPKRKALTQRTRRAQSSQRRGSLEPAPAVGARSRLGAIPPLRAADGAAFRSGGREE